MLAEGKGSWRGGGMLGGRGVDEPFAEAGPLLPSVAGGCQVQMLLLAPCLCQPVFFSFSFCFFGLFGL